MSQFWKIEEAVGGGLYMDLDGIFETEAAALAAIERHQHHEHMRAVQYQTGGWRDGPVRVVGYYR